MSILMALWALAAPAAGAPSSGWTVDWGKHECVLARQSSGKIFALRKTPGSRMAGVWLVDPAWKPRSGPDVTVSLAGPNGPAPLGREIRIETTGAGRAVVIYRLEDAELAPLRTATAISANDGRGSPLQIALPNIGGALDALQQCEDSALREWGIDPRAHRSYARPPKPERELASYVSHQDYPEEAAREGISGEVTVRLDVGTDGRVTGCAALVSSGHASLDAATCRILRSRPRFSPARDQEDKPVSSRVITKLRWLTS